jgi:hypothetical protein
MKMGSKSSSPTNQVRTFNAKVSAAWGVMIGFRRPVKRFFNSIR